MNELGHGILFGVGVALGLFGGLGGAALGAWTLYSAIIKGRWP